MKFFVKYKDQIVVDNELWEISKGQPFNEGGREIFDDKVAISYFSRIYEGDWEVFDKCGSFKVIPLDECEAFYISNENETKQQVSPSKFKELFLKQFER